MDENCEICDEKYGISGRGYNRKSLSAKLPRSDRSAADLMEQEFQIEVTPTKKRFICNKCSNLCQTLDTSIRKKDDAKESLTKGYLKRKLESVPATPRKTPGKKKRVFSTPVRKRHVITPAQVG